MLLLYKCGQGRDESAEMAVYRRIAIGMADIDRLAESEGPDLYSRDISVRSRIYRQVLPMLGPDIEAHMVVIGAELTEIRGQADGNTERVPEIMLRIIGDDEKGRGKLRKSRQAA